MRERFTRWLAERQVESGARSDGEFAREVLGIPKSTLSAVKTGRRAVSPSFIVKLQAAYPARCSEILDLYLEEEAA